MFPEGSDRGSISYMEGERVPKTGAITAEGIRKNVCVICELSGQKWWFEGT